MALAVARGRIGGSDGTDLTLGTYLPAPSDNPTRSSEYSDSPLSAGTRRIEIETRNARATAGERCSLVSSHVAAFPISPCRIPDIIQ